MVYSGKPSTGCYLCRRRKIKCDEARPGCGNCAVHGKECPGYRPALELQDDRAHSQAKKRRAVLSRNESSNDSEDFSPINALDFALTPRPSWLTETSLEDRALCYFFDQYAIPRASYGASGALESIPPLYVLCRENEIAGNASSCLRWAVDATALSAFAHEANAPHLRVSAREKYGMALRGLQEALNSPEESVQDGNLATILLLVIFEDINGEREGLQSSHTPGLELFARRRSRRRPENNYSRCLFHFAYTQLQIQILGFGGRPQHDLDLLVELFDVTDPLQRLMGIVTKLSQLVLKSPALLSQPPPDASVPTKEDLCEFETRARSLDSELSHWCRTLPHQWLPRIVYSTTGESLITYIEISTGSLWNFYRSARIILQGIRQNIYERLEALSESFPQELTTDDDLDATPPEVIQNMISDICRSIPFLFGDIDSSGTPISPALSQGSNSSRLRAIEGYEMMWPMWHICTTHHSTSKQRRQAKAALQRVGTELGIKLATKLAAQVVC